MLAIYKEVYFLCFFYLYKKENVMVGLTVKDTKEQVVFTLDKKNITDDVIMEMVKIARLDALVEKADFDKSILTLGEELKQIWWEENKDDFLKDVVE